MVGYDKRVDGGFKRGMREGSRMFQGSFWKGSKEGTIFKSAKDRSAKTK